MEFGFEPVQPGNHYPAQAARLQPLELERQPPAFQVEQLTHLPGVDQVERIEQREENGGGQNQAHTAQCPGLDA